MHTAQWTNDAGTGGVGPDHQTLSGFAHVTTRQHSKLPACPCRLCCSTWWDGSGDGRWRVSVLLRWHQYCSGFLTIRLRSTPSLFMPSALQGEGGGKHLLRMLLATLILAATAHKQPTCQRTQASLSFFTMHLLLGFGSPMLMSCCIHAGCCRCTPVMFMLRSITPGEWLGPWTLCHALHTLVNRVQPGGLCTHIAASSGGGAPVLYASRHVLTAWSDPA